ncbi:nucleotidyltransferase domain-containing protein [bacterium]|nr:nucleotidyltransferase domain-containing protein [bacterium]
MVENRRNQFGLTERDIITIQTILRKYSEIQSTVIFGSRAKGTFSIGSDIDLAVFGDVVNETLLYKIKADFSDSSLPYFIDLICYSSLKNSALKEHIDRVGISFPTT